MAITFVGADVSSGTSVTIPTHQAGDLLVVHAVGENAPGPQLPSGWTLIGEARSGATARSAVAYRVASGSGTASGTWSSAEAVAVSVFRGADSSDPIGDFDSNTGTNFAVRPLTLEVQDGSSWVYVSIGADSADPGEGSGLVTRASFLGEPNSNVVYDTNGGVSDWNSQTIPGNDSGANAVKFSVELLAAPEDPGQDLDATVDAFSSTASLETTGVRSTLADADPAGTSVSMTSTSGAASASTGSDPLVSEVLLGDVSASDFNPAAYEVLPVHLTEVPDTGVHTNVQVTIVRTDIPVTAVATSVSSPPILTVVPSSAVTTSLGDTSIETGLPTAEIETDLDVPEVTTVIDDPAIETDQGGA